MNLRWYQQEAVQAVWDYLRTEKGSPLVVLPTGSGKTPVIAELARQVVAWRGRVLILAHVKELLEQAREKLALFVDPSLVGVYSAGLKERTTSTPIVVAGIQSVFQRVDELGEFKLIIVDEAHLIPPSGSGRYRTLLEAEKSLSPDARLVGLTATPYRMGCGWISNDRATNNDDARFDRLFDSIVYEVGTDKLIADGTLSCVTSRQAKRAPDFSEVHTVRGDFDEAEVEKVLLRKNVLESACQEIVDLSKDRKKVLVFCNRRESARRCARLLSEYDSEFAAEVVDGETDSSERADLVRRFKSEEGDLDLFGERARPLKYICNVGVFTTGFDAPNVDVVAILRPTKSLTLYQQTVGRGLRKSPNKHDCLILDFGGNIDRHGPIDLPAPKPSEISAGKKPWRVCPTCGAVVSIELAVCPLCNAELIVRQKNDPNAGLSFSSSRSAILSSQGFEEPSVEELDVLSVDYYAHYKKDGGGAPTMKVRYACEKFRVEFEWVCPEHENWVRRRFEKWWRAKSRVEPPRTTEEAVELAKAGALATPKRIRVTKKATDRFAKIEWLEQTPIPDFSADAVPFDVPIDDNGEIDGALGFSEFDQFEETTTAAF